MDITKEIENTKHEIEEAFSEGVKFLNEAIAKEEYNSNLFYADHFILSNFDLEEIERLVNELQELQLQEKKEDEEALNREYERSQL